MKLVEPIFKQKHIDDQILSMVFEEIHNQDLLTTICLIHFNIKRLGAKFHEMKPNMMKDSLRIVCLRVCFVINQLIVQAATEQNDTERKSLAKDIIDHLLGVEFGANLLGQGDRHRVVVAQLLEESYKHSSGLLKHMGIDADF